MMKCSPINSNETITRENRKYWRLGDILPSLNEVVRLSSIFKLQNEMWFYSAHLSLASLTLAVSCTSCDFSDDFNVMAGIFGDSGEEIAILETQPVFRTFRRYRFDQLISYSKLQFLIRSNEDLFFFLEIEKKDEEKAQKTKVLKRKYQADFKEMLLSGVKHDLTIIVKHRKFQCHTNILNARSPVFSAMLEHEMREKSTGEVFIADSEPSTFQEFLLYLYTGSDEHLNWENVSNLYKLGDKYCVEDLKYLCVEHMKANISMKNLFEFFVLSQHHSDSELSIATIKFFLQNSEVIIKSKTWDEFLKSNPAEASTLLKTL